MKKPKTGFIYVNGSQGESASDYAGEHLEIADIVVPMRGEFRKCLKGMLDNVAIEVIFIIGVIKNDIRIHLKAGGINVTKDGTLNISAYVCGKLIVVLQDLNRDDLKKPLAEFITNICDKKHEFGEDLTVQLDEQDVETHKFELLDANMPNKLIQADIRKNVDGKRLEENVNESLVDEVFEPVVGYPGITEGVKVEYTKNILAPPSEDSTWLAWRKSSRASSTPLTGSLDASGDCLASPPFQGFLKNETRNFYGAKRENIEVTTDVLRQANSLLTEKKNNNIHVVNNDYEKDLIASDTETEITELEVEFDDSVDDLTSSTELSTSDPMTDSIKQSSRLKDIGRSKKSKSRSQWAKNARLTSRKGRSGYSALTRNTTAPGGESIGFEVPKIKRQNRASSSDASSDSPPVISRKVRSQKNVRVAGEKSIPITDPDPFGYHKLMDSIQITSAVAANESNNSTSVNTIGKDEIKDNHDATIGNDDNYGTFSTSMESDDTGNARNRFRKPDVVPGAAFDDAPNHLNQSAAQSAAQLFSFPPPPIYRQQAAGYQQLSASRAAAVSKNDDCSLQIRRKTEASVRFSTNNNEYFVRQDTATNPTDSSKLPAFVPGILKKSPNRVLDFDSSKPDPEVSGLKQTKYEALGKDFSSEDSDNSDSESDIPQLPEMTTAPAIKLKHYPTKPLQDARVVCISIETLEKVWLIRIDEKVARSNLQEEIERESINAKKTKTVAKPGFDYFCFDSADGGYYRMRIISIHGNTAKALKLDHGTTCTLSLDHIYPLSRSLAVYPIHVFPLYIRGVNMKDANVNLDYEKIFFRFSSYQLRLKDAKPLVTDGFQGYEGHLYLVNSESDDILQERTLENCVNFYTKFGLLDITGDVDVEDLSEFVDSGLSFHQEFDEKVVEEKYFPVNFAHKDVKTNLKGLICGFDKYGTMWVLPNHLVEAHNKVMNALQTVRCDKLFEFEEVKIGETYVTTKNKTRQRILITNLLRHRIFKGVLIDQLGEAVFVMQDEILHLPAGVKSELYLVPVQVYGIKPTDDFKSKSEFLFKTLKEKYSLNCQVIPKIETTKCPIQGEVLIYERCSENFHNLAYVLIQERLYKPYVLYEDWKDTYVSSELTWLNLAAQLEFITDPLPSTFIVKKGMWFPNCVVAYPDGSDDCDLTSQNCNLITIQPQFVMSEIDFQSKNRKRIVGGLQDNFPQLKLVTESFKLRKRELARAARERQPTDEWAIGEHVIAYYQDDETPSASEWARGKIRSLNNGTHTATIYFTDYGHQADNIPVSNLRKMSVSEKMQPIFCFNVRFEKPDDAKYLKTIRDQLEFAEINPRLGKVTEIDVESGIPTIKFFQFKLENGEQVLYKIV